jgi:hypothetical protein
MVFTTAWLVDELKKPLTQRMLNAEITASGNNGSG